MTPHGSPDNDAGRPAAHSTGRAVLGFDTATPDTVVALQADGLEPLELRHAPAPGERPGHASQLLPLARALLAHAGLTFGDVDRIGVGVGPGTFTGLRIGISTARALAQARGLEIAGVSSLAALARGIEARPERPRLALIDARRREVFGALHGADGGVIWEPFVAGPEALVGRIDALGSPPIAAGDGSLRFRQELKAAGVDVPPKTERVHRMAARHICALADPADRRRPEQVKPSYLRRPDAEIWRDQQSHGIGRGSR
jgi:tRNA threonylcarbamoyladenosine biosynthesis protein TsaB